MNSEFSFETIPFEIDPEFQGELFEGDVELERGRSFTRGAGKSFRPRSQSRLQPQKTKRFPIQRPILRGYGTAWEPYPSTSERVRWIQDCLNQAIGLQLPVTGIMSPETRSAVRSFQKQQGLSVSGIVGSDTEKALLDACTPSTERVQNRGEVYEFETLELESASMPTVRPVNAKFVSCYPPSNAIAAITGRDPVGTIQKANTRAIELLDNVIKQLKTTRKKIVAGAKPTAPTVSNLMRQALQHRFRMNVNDRNIWIRSGSGSIDVLIRRFQGARQILADGWMRYVCLGRANVNFTLGGKTCAGQGCTGNTRAVSCGGISQIVLCVPWWRDPAGDNQARLNNQAKTLLHECLHIYFEFIGDTGNLANAHCYDHFVLDLNSLPIPADRIHSCP